MSSLNVETWLDAELEAEFKKLSTMTPGTEDHKIALDGLTKLVDKKIEINRLESECEEKEAARKSEELLKQQQLKDEKDDRLIKNILTACGIALPLLVTIWGTKVSLNFEKEGTFTSIMGKGFINKLLPKK